MLLIAKLIAAVLGTYYLACFVQTILHARLGHRRVGGSIFRTHVLDHHGTYSDIFTAESYIDEDHSLTALYLIPVALCTALAFWLLPLSIAVAIALTFLTSLWLHSYVHVQYHLEESVLNNYQWFRRRQRLHRIHHELPDRNFGVLEFVWDRVLGTYSDEASSDCEVTR